MPFNRTTVDSVDLANFIVAKLGPMPHLKLQKLVYYIEAWHLAIFGESIIEDDFQAWPHGPVSTRIWHRFKSPESPVLGEIRLSSTTAKAVRQRFPATVTKEQNDLIDDVLAEYGDKSAYHLECLTHGEKPWQIARDGLHPAAKSTNNLSKVGMERFYKGRLKAS